MKFVAIIPARKGSKGIKNKNFKKFNNKPLIYWTLRAAKKSKFIEIKHVTFKFNEIKKINKVYKKIY